jgi:translation initiation factor 2 subunit 3
MYFYGDLEPQVNDYVVIKVKEIKEFGYICELPEFDNKIAYLNINDITTEKIRKVQDLKKYLKPNTIDVLEVKEIDQVGNINLNRKYLDEQIVKNVYQKYNLYEKIYNYSVNNIKVIEQERNKIINELKNYKIGDINIDLFLNKFPILSNLKLNTEFIQELQDIYYFEYMDYINVYELKEKFLKIKQKYDNILDIYIINLKIGKFSIKVKNKKELEYFEKIKDEIIEMKIDMDDLYIKPQEIKNEEVEIEQPLLNIGIIGHVSHGKTTLIQRLTNVDTKKYKKELETNKTLKLGYTNAYVTKCCCTDSINYINKKCDNVNNTCISKLVSIVDCPGHHVLMNTMLCGTSIMDTSIIMIASNESCPQPQTVDHIMAITINETKSNHFDNSLVVLNKCDLIQKTEALSRYNEIKEFINGSIVENCNILPTSAQKNINLNHVTEWMFNYVTARSISCNDKVEKLKGLIVRTFDINKPGTSINDISGLVIGCSITEGVLNIGDEIIILPEYIKTRVYELYTDKVPLNKARKGGLIGVKTDLNTTYSEILTGSFFIKANEYNQKYFKSENSELEMKYFIRKDNSSFKKLFKEGEYIDVNIQGKFIKNCEIKSKKDKYVKINIPYNTYIQDDNLKISFLKNNTLIGYGNISLEKQEIVKNKLNLNMEFNFTENLNKLYQELRVQEINNRKNLIKLPNPIVSYSNTVSIFQNFIEISNMISANHINLGNYIMNELGLQNMSINDDQLILKGKTNENRIENILTKYLLEYKLCQNCLSYETFYNKVQNCRLLVCSKCNYTVKK